MNVLIVPSADRQLQLSLIEKYNRIGFNVFFPKLKSIDLTWWRTARWPSMVTKNSKNCDVKNLQVYRNNWGTEEEKTFFGEDFFVTSNLPLYESFSYDSNITCDIVDLNEIPSDFFDFYHTTRGNIIELNKIIAFLRDRFPKAKWISSTCNQSIRTQLDLGVKNIAMTMPACYQDRYNPQKYNQIHIFGTRFERESLGLDENVDINNKRGVASFNHNYFIRYPSESRLFLQAANECKKSNSLRKIVNYGGNISKTGADIRYDGKGPNGNLKTLGVRDALKLQGELSLISLLKDDDHGGGCVWNSLTCKTPVLVHKDYYNKTKMSRWFEDRKTCIVVDKNDLNDVVRWFKISYEEPELLHDLSRNLDNMFQEIEEHFFETFPQFIENAR